MVIVLLIFCTVIVVVGLLVWGPSTLIGLIRARGVPYVPLNRRQLGLIAKNIKIPTDVNFVDLGCGDGRVLRLFEKQGLTNLDGYEVNFWAYLIARTKNFFLRSKTKVYFKNFRKINLAQYDVVFCYLLDFYLSTLREKFDGELKPGTKIISYAFAIKDWRSPEIIYTSETKKNLDRIFIYTI